MGDNADRTAHEIIKSLQDRCGIYHTSAVRQIAAAIRSAVACERERCAQIARGNPTDHADCEHAEGYIDGRLDAEAAIRATWLDSEFDSLRKLVAAAIREAEARERERCANDMSHNGKRR